MSKKHYIALATVIRREYDFALPSQRSVLVDTTKAIADVLFEDNPNFSRERFLFAALGEGS